MNEGYPENNLVLPAEWEPQWGVQLTWPHEDSDWKPYLKEITATYIEMARAITRFEMLLVVANFADSDTEVEVTLPAHAFDYLQLKETTVTATDLLSKEKESMILRKDGRVRMMIGARSGRVWKLKA